MKQYQTEQIQQLHVTVGERFQLESLRQAVVPPYMMLMPFIELPESLQLDRQTVLEEEGVHGCSYVLLTKSPGQGVLTVGFQDLRSGEITHHKRIEVKAIAV